jgi:hypothetical protein
MEPFTVTPSSLPAIINGFNYANLEPAVATAARNSAEDIRGNMSLQVEAILEIGKQLIDMKAALGHGYFGTWIDLELGFGQRTAQNYMAAATVFGSKCAMVSHLRPTTLYAIASPSTPEPARDILLERLNEGDLLADDEATSFIRDCRRVAKSAKHINRRERSTPKRKLAVEQHVSAYAKRQDMAERKRRQAKVEAATLIASTIGPKRSELIELLEAAGYGGLAEMIARVR